MDNPGEIVAKRQIQLRTWVGDQAILRQFRGLFQPSGDRSIIALLFIFLMMCFHFIKWGRIIAGFHLS
jgi:hypothetical protein